ncbi:E3 ubiquitin-protein ligase TRIM38-like [Sorex araneus]|uniref:E3 ubiquitin-protein ligase TRIM38-like n=1 Tax=Sorex araneus TaxID=42254 RepID=UPI00243370AC|nr:E3 ubiquitin-protein ligase TRIM38-like [Sorex araneus]
MASSSATEKLREESTCSICLELMTEPVSIDCGHSFCLVCVMGLIGNQSSETSSLETFHCPQCRSPLKWESIRPNKQLQNIIETIKGIEFEKVCEEHGEQLHLFCKDSDQLICCERTPQRRGLGAAPVEDAVQRYKEKLQKTLKNMEDLCQIQKVLTQVEIDKLEDKIALKRQKIQFDFQNLHNFLYEEEKSYLWKLEKEKEQTFRRLQDNLVHLERQSKELKKHILVLEKKSQDSGQNFLQDVKDIGNGKSAVKLEIPEVMSLEIQTLCHVPDLYFDVKKFLKSYQVSVTLDEDTAHENLILSENRREVNHRHSQKKFDNPRRFREISCVLGCESFTSGRHYFEVDVGKAFMWNVGVCLETVHRDIKDEPDPENGFWSIRLSKWNGYEALTNPSTSLTVRERLHTLGIFLDYEAGLVSFYNMETGSHIFTFPQASFCGVLRPYFLVHLNSPLFLPLPNE